MFFLPYEKFGVVSPLFVDSFNELLHAGGAFLLHFFSDMAVHIQGKGCCGMARMLLHSFDIVTGQAGDNSIEVAEVMEPGFIQSDFLDNLFKSLLLCTHPNGWILLYLIPLFFDDFLHPMCFCAILFLFG